MEPKRVSVLSPVLDNCATAYTMALAQMAKLTAFAISNPSLLKDQRLAAAANCIDDFTIETFSSSILPSSRQFLAKQAIEQGATHLLWIDSDMKFPPDTILQFAKSDEPLIGINASNRRYPFRCLARSADDEMIRTTDDSTGYEKAWRLGFGMVWTAAEIFERMEMPWFEFQYIEDQGIFRGEDYSFFDKARALGYQPLLDHDLSKRVLHMGTWGFSPQMASMQEG